MAVQASRVACFFHVAGNARVAREITLNVSLCGAAFEVKLAGQTEGAHAVDQTEVDDLGDAALVGVDFDRCQAENFGRCGAVHVFALGEGFKQTGVF